MNSPLSVRNWFGGGIARKTLGNQRAHCPALYQIATTLTHNVNNDFTLSSGLLETVPELAKNLAGNVQRRICVDASFSPLLNSTPKNILTSGAQEDQDPPTALGVDELFEVVAIFLTIQGTVENNVPFPSFQQVC